MKTQKLLTTAQAAEMLEVSINTMSWWRITDQGPPWYKFGKKTYRYPEKDLMDWIKERRRNAGTTS